jgi:hypothetical protein
MKDGDTSHRISIFKEAMNHMRLENEHLKQEMQTMKEISEINKRFIKEVLAQ